MKKVLYKDYGLRSYVKSPKLAVIMVLFGVVGTITVLTSFAATSYLSISPEDGTISGNAIKTDATGADGQVIQFGSAAFGLAITAPQASATVKGNAVPLTASYSGNVQNVEFYLDGSKIATATLNSGVASATFNSTSIANGTKVLTAKAWDAPVGQAFTVTADAAPINIVINNTTSGGDGAVGAGNGGSTAPRQPMVNVRNYGAVGNGTTSDTSAIRAAIAALGSGGGTVYFPAGTYRQTDIIQITTPNVYLWSDTASAVIKTTEIGGHLIWFKSGTSGGGIYGLTLDSNFKGVRQLPDEGGKYRLFIDRPNVVIRGITLDGSGLMGIVIREGSSNVLIENNIVKNTGADGIHNTGGTHDNIIRNNTLDHIGDDCVAVVSPFNAGLVKNILIENNRCTDSWQARGYTVVGGDNITIQNNLIDKTSVAGIYLASESVYGGTPGATNIKILNNTIRRAVSLYDPIHPNTAYNHASILIYGRGSYYSSNILIAGNTIETQANGPAIIHVENSIVQGLNIIGNTFRGTITPFQLSMSSSQYNLKNNTFNGTAISNQINNPGIIPAGY